MTSQQETFANLRIATGGLPASGRQRVLAELFDRSIGMDIDADREQSVDLQIHAVPGLRRALMLRPFTARAARPASRLSDGDDTVCLMIKLGGHMALRQRRTEGVPGLGDGVLLVYRQPSQVHFEDATYLSIRVPFQELAMLADVDAASARCIRGEGAALALLRQYVASLPMRIDDREVARLVATHVYDLMALAIGASADGEELARSRSVPAARLRAIQADLTRDTALPIDEIARRQGVTPRYVQKLFESEGTTFGEFVTERRLDAARAMLRSPRYAAWSIAGIAFEAGFQDLSHFNRRFRRRFGGTPGDWRRGALAG